MKTIKYLFQLVILSLVVGMATSCARDFDEPPLTEPKYEPSGVAITIEALKEMHKTVSDPVLIKTDYYVKAMVVGNDVSGNIFKQLYVQDETGGLQLGVDQNNVATEYGTGQEVFIQLRGLYILKYGGEFQIGYGGSNANRIPWEFFKEHVHRNGFANPKDAVAKELDMNYLYDKSVETSEHDKLVGTLVTFSRMHFVNGGDSLFIRVANGTTEDIMQDPHGNKVTMRTSSYASPFVGKYLPYGNGHVTGILGRHNGGWQFTLRDWNDVHPDNFDGKDPEVAPRPDGEIFHESFGGDASARFKIADYTDYDMGAPIKYSDISGFADVRALQGNVHVWLPSGGDNKDRDSYFTIEGVNAKGHDNLVMTYELAANLYNKGESANLNNIAVEINGKNYPIASKPVSNEGGDNGKFHLITVENFPAEDNVKVEFISRGKDNAVGFRLDNIIIKTK